MDNRRQVEDNIELVVKCADWKCDILWSDLMKVTAGLPTDKILGWGWKEEKYAAFGGYDDEDKIQYVFRITVGRQRPETDDEYFKRQQEEEIRKKEFDNRERLEYLRLKAKFETELNSTKHD